MSTWGSESDSVAFDAQSLEALQVSLRDFEFFRSRVIVRDDLFRAAVLLLGIGITSAFMNVLVLNAQGLGSWAELFTAWFSASGRTALLSFLLRFLAYAAVFSLVLGGVLLGVSPVLQARRLRTIHANFLIRGWLARGVKLGLTVDDDSLWIRKPVDLLAYTGRPAKVAKTWEKDLERLRADVQDRSRALMMCLLLSDRQFHGALTVGSLRGKYEFPLPGGSTLVGFGPLHKMRAEGQVVVVAPPSDSAVTDPQAGDKLIFWLRDL